MDNTHNVYDLRREQNLYHILDVTACEPTEIPGNVAVILSFFYDNTCKYYIHFIDEIVNNIDVYVVSPNEKLLDMVEVETKRNVVTIKKNNRGRDISALLIASKRIFEKYDYVCFVHDKKEKFDEQADDSQLWIYNMWENTLSSEGYINRILKLFEENNTLGLLLPPEPIGEYINCWYINKWSSNYVNTVRLCERLGVEANLDESIPPIAFGTVFWCRTIALKKLTEYPWKYEDFKDEPLHFDGEINHAIERALPYIVQNAGYETHMVMTNKYAARLMSKSQYIAQRAFSVLNSELGIRYAFELELLDKKKSRMREFCSRFVNIYLYGAGERAKDAIKLLQLINVVPCGFIVTAKTENKEISGIKVYSLDEFINSNFSNYGIIIATNQMHAKEITNVLMKNGIRDYIPFTI